MRKPAVTVYRLLLRIYPEEFRRKFQSAMVVDFEALAKREGPVRALVKEGSDVVSSGLRERIAGLGGPKPVRKGAMVELFGKDLRFAVRTLLKSPAFTALSVGSLALGIGANAAIFTLVDAVLWKPMPVEAPERLVALYTTRPTARFPMNFSYPNYLDLRENEVFSDLVGFQGIPLSMNVSREPEMVWGEMVTGNYFSGLGVRPARGRVFLIEDGQSRGAHPVAVLSHDFWKRRFDEDASVVGRNVQLNGHDFTIVGVAPPGFSGAKLLGFAPDLWVPLAMHRHVFPGNDRLLERRGGGWLQIRGRLAPGVTFGEAEAAARTMATRLEAAYPEANRNWELHLLRAPSKVEPFIEVITGGVLPIASGVLLGIVGIVLLVACANVASLQLARTLGRQREMAIRLSLGSSRVGLVRHLLLESVFLGLLGGALGLWLSDNLLELALGLNPVMDFSIDYGVGIDGRVLTFTVALSMLAGLLSGLFPAVKTLRRDVSASLKEAGPSLAGSGTGRRWIVVPQLALSLVALVSAGLLLQSFRNVSAASPGFRTEDVLLARMNVGLQGYDDSEGKTLYRRLVERLRRAPGVASVSLAWPLPLDAYSEGANLFPEDAELGPDDEGLTVFYSAVSEDYFETLGTALLHGRRFRTSDDEDAPRVAVVNETLARRLWPNDDAVGNRFRLGREGPVVEVVGIAEDGKYLTLGEEPRPYLYLPLLQNYESTITIALHADAPPMSLEVRLRDEVRALDPELPVYGVKTIGEFLDRSLSAPRALALSVALFAVLAVSLAAVGVYGLMSFAVSQRRHEIGLRMALGAQERDVLALLLRQAGFIVAMGIGAGLAAAWASTRLMESLLYGVSASSSAIFAGVAVLLALVALLGSYVPSRRATKLDPVVTLRHE